MSQVLLEVDMRKKSRFHKKALDVFGKNALRFANDSVFELTLRRISDKQIAEEEAQASKPNQSLERRTRLLKKIIR